MRIDVYKMFYENYKFSAELDTGAELGSCQLTLWYAEKLPLDAVPLSSFSLIQLLQTLIEPLQSLLRTQLQQMLQTELQPLEDDLTWLLRPFQSEAARIEQQLPTTIKQQVHKLLQQIKQVTHRIESEFRERELLSLARTCFDLQALATIRTSFSPWQFLRSFYFEEVNESYIRIFCHKFSFDVAYRQDVQSIQVHWARRNALFERNLLSVVGEATLLANDSGYYQKARALFRWLDVCVTEIMALPAYKHLQALDGPASTHADVDPAILPTVELLRQVPGITLRTSCQGVSGKISFQGYELLAISAHDEYAHVSFTALTTQAHDIIVSLLAEYPTITTVRIPCNFSSRLVLRSTGDNIRFRVELLSLAQRVLTLIQQQAATSAADLQILHYDWQYSLYPARCPACSDPGGILPSRLHWLCLPTQVEQTLALIFHLNYWLHVSDTLFYADRRGLAEIKAVVLQQAYLAGALLPVAYIDGTTNFAYDYMCELAVDLATEAFVVRLASLFTPEASAAADDEWDASARRLFMRITGQPAVRLADIEALDMLQIGKYIDAQLQTLILQARVSRQPIPAHKLAALFIEPTDLLDLHANRSRTWLSWQDLDTEELNRLDPEGSSLVAFQYHSLYCTYSLHLPLRVAETFVSAQHLSMLKQQPGHGKEYAIIAGQVVTEATSQLHSIQSLLSALLVDISTLCPHKLVHKTAHLAWERRSKQVIWEDELPAY